MTGRNEGRDYRRDGGGNDLFFSENERGSMEFLFGTKIEGGSFSEKDKKGSVKNKAGY